MSVSRNIVILAQFAGSPEHGMVTGYYYLARQWIAEGYAVTIVSASYSHTRYKNPSVSERLSEEIIDGIRYVWVRVPDYSSSSKMGRILSILAFSWFSLTLKISLTSASLVVCSSHHPLAIFAAERLSSKLGAKLVFEVRDLWPLTLIELGKASRLNPFILLMQYAEDRAYRRADAVVSVLSHSLPYMKSRGLEESKFHYIPNGVLDSTKSISQSQEFEVKAIYSSVEALKKGGAKLIGYCGKLGVANALSCLIESLEFLDDCVHVVFLGGGPELGNLEELAIREGVIDRVHFLGVVEKQFVSGFLELIDIAYLGLSDASIFKHGVSPTKLGDYMLASKPILAAFSDPEMVVERSECGVCCAPDNPEAVANGAKKLLEQSSSDLEQMGANGRSWVLKYRNYKCLGRKFLELV